MKKIVTIIILSAFFAVGAHAQDTSLQKLPLKWTLEYCIAYAKKNNIQINTLRLNTSSAEEDLKQSKAAVLPDLSASVTQDLINRNNGAVVVGGTQNQANFSSGYGVNSSIILYNGGFLKNDIRSKALTVQSSNLSVQETENDITLSLTQAYLNILLAGETITYLKDVLATSQTQLKQGQQRFDAGGLARKDLAQLEAQAASDQYNLVNETNTYSLDIVLLKQILQLPSSYPFDVTVPDSIVVQDSIAPLQESQATAQSTRPEVKNGEIGVQIAQTELEKSRAGIRPTISVGAGLATSYGGGQSLKYFPQLNNNFYQSLAVTAGFPIYSRRVYRTAVAKSQIQIQQANLSLLNTKTILDQQVEQAYINLRNAQAQYAAADSQLKANTEIYKISNEQLQLGAINTLDLQLQKNLYVQALQAFTQAKYTVVLFSKIYAFYTGVPVKL